MATLNEAVEDLQAQVLALQLILGSFLDGIWHDKPNRNEQFDSLWDFAHRSCDALWTQLPEERGERMRELTRIKVTAIVSGIRNPHADPKYRPPGEPPARKS